MILTLLPASHSQHNFCISRFIFRAFRLAIDCALPLPNDTRLWPPGALPKKLNLFLTAPHDVFAQNEAVDAVYLPSREGVLGVMPGTVIGAAV